jgi:hypothetical protein
MTPSRAANIGPREQTRRIRQGVVAFGISVALAAWLIASGASLRWRSLLFVPLFVAGLGYFQARDKT